MYPNYFTFGFGGRSGIMFKKYNPNWDVEVWRLDSDSDRVQETDYENVHFKVFPAIGHQKTGIYSFKFLRALIKLPKNTILNVQNIHNPLLYQVLLFSPHQLIITVQHHGDYHPLFVIKNFKGLKRIKAFIFFLFEKILLNRVSYFFVIDIDHIKYLKTTYRKLDGNYSIQPLGIDFSLYKKIPKAKACNELGLDPNRKYIFFVGQYNYVKEVDRLCEVYCKVREIKPEIQMFVAGGGIDDQYYNDIKRCGAIDFGKVPNTDLFKYYSAADVYVCLTFRPDYFGGIGLAMLEAMATGLPVICKSLENLPENIRQFVGKMPMDENEMERDILEVIENREYYSDGRKYVEELYDYKIIQKNTSLVYYNLVHKRITN
jgi:glycosyltransferase involved in cell wall biosynthesis